MAFSIRERFAEIGVVPRLLIPLPDLKFSKLIWVMFSWQMVELMKIDLNCQSDRN